MNDGFPCGSGECFFIMIESNNLIIGIIKTDCLCDRTADESESDKFLSYADFYLKKFYKDILRDKIYSVNNITL